MTDYPNPTDKPDVHIVGIAIDGNPTYVLDVPTYQGREAAERRAVWSIIHRDRLDPDRVTVCGPYPEEDNA